MSLRPLALAALGLGLGLPALAQDGPATPQITVGTLVNGTMGGVVVGPEDAIRERLILELAKSGHNAVAPAAASRDRVDAGNARYILNGNVVGQACNKQPTWSGCRWRIQWSVVDLERGAVILEATGMGEASLPSPNPSSAMYIEIIARAALPLARSPELRAMLADTGAAEPIAEGWNRTVGARPCTVEPLSLPADTRKLQPTMFTVSTQYGRTDGVLFSPDGLGLTAAGPLADFKVATATMADGNEAGLTVLRIDESADLALVHLRDRAGACAPVNARPLTLDEPVFALGTRGGQGWGLRSGKITDLVVHSSGKHLDTDAAVADLSSRAPVFDAQGRWIASAPPAGSEAILAQDALARLDVIPSESADSLENIERLPRREGEPPMLELGGAIEAPLAAPMGSARGSTPIGQTPGATQTVVGGTMLGIGGLVGVPTLLAWAMLETDFEVAPQERAVLGGITAGSAALAIGGGLLLYNGLKKADEGGVEISASPGRIHLRGRF